MLEKMNFKEEIIMAEEKKNRGKDLAGVLKSKMAPPIAKCIVAYIPTLWLKRNIYKLELGTPAAWFINLVLPDSGFGQDLSDMSNDILSTQIIEMAKDKIKDWENAKNKLQYERLKKRNKTPVTDADYPEFKKFFTFPNETFDPAIINSFGKSIAKALKSMVGKVKGIDWSKINLGDFDQKLADQKIPEKINGLTAGVNTNNPAKPIIKQSGVSCFLDRLSDTLDKS